MTVAHLNIGIEVMKASYQIVTTNKGKNKMSVIKVNSTKGMTATTKYSFTRSLKAADVKKRKLQAFTVAENSAVLANVEILARELGVLLGIEEFNELFDTVTIYLGDSHGRFETVKLASVVDAVKLIADSKISTLPFSVNGKASHGIKIHHSNLSTAIASNPEWELQLAFELLECVLFIQSDVYGNKLYNGKASRGIRSKPYYDHATADSALAKLITFTKWDNSKAAREVPNYNTFYPVEYLQPFKNFVRSSKAAWEVIKGIGRHVDAPRKRDGLGSFTIQCNECQHSLKIGANIIAQYLKALGTDGFDKLTDTAAVEPVSHCGNKMELLDNKREEILEHFLAIQTAKAAKLAAAVK